MAPISLAPTDLEEPMLPFDSDPMEVADRLAIMRHQEETTYKIRDYLAESVNIRKRASKPVDEDCRVKMCEWCNQVVDFCKFRRETVGIGMSYLDRYLCTPEGRDALCNRKAYQLAAMTALYIAIKIHEPLEMETSLLADLSRGCYTEMEFVEMEEIMLQALKWRVNGPTALGFAQHYLAFLPDSVHPSVAEAIFDYARYQTELSTSAQGFVSTKPSVIGFAAVLNAMEGMNTNLLPLKLQGKFLRNIERFGEVMVEDVENTQARLSLLLVDMLSGHYADIIPLMTETLNDDEFMEDCKPVPLSRRNSPKSVIRANSYF